MFVVTTTLDGTEAFNKHCSNYESAVVTANRWAKEEPGKVVYLLEIRSSHKLEYKDKPTTLPYTKGTSTLQVRFESLAKQWEEDTTFHSSTHEICLDPSYLEIIALGPRVVPFIIEHLRESRNSHWSLALSALTRTELVLAAEHVGVTEEICRFWLNWWEDHKERFSSEMDSN